MLCAWNVMLGSGIGHDEAQREGEDVRGAQGHGGCRMSEWCCTPCRSAALPVQVANAHGFHGSCSPPESERAWPKRDILSQLRKQAPDERNDLWAEMMHLACQHPCQELEPGDWEWDRGLNVARGVQVSSRVGSAGSAGSAGVQQAQWMQGVQGCGWG